MTGRAAAVLGGALLLGHLGCARCGRRPPSADQDVDRHEDESSGEDEDEELARPNYWRVQIRIAGHGDVTSAVAHLTCRGDDQGQHGDCGPILLRFDELHPPLLRATAAPGWRFVRWESSIREPNGTTRARQGPMPDGPLYIDGFGYSDTGELETTTAVFEIAPVGVEIDSAATPRGDRPRSPR